MANESAALAIVEEALGVADPAARAALVAERCAGDAPLRARVEQLLALDQADFRLMPTESFVRPLGVMENIPARIGPYRVTGEIARGGMGAVVKAERDDGVFQATVAIKLIRGDLASDRAKARFAEERRILARLRHPGIVRILDGGEAQDRPWLAMDHIDGRPVTGALAERGATLAERLSAFAAVCDAVAYAHRNLVIHADIKPSNVLMSEDGRVHLLDFGIARLIVALDQGEAGDPYPLTRGYAAPERGVGIAPTIASDVFSLGVLLLEMLGFPAPAEGDTMVPGTRLPGGRLEGDLAALAARALADRPEDRYPDVAALAEDLRRHRLGLPLVARAGDGWRYVAGCFVRRHRLGLALAALAAIGLVATSVVSTLSYVRAERARAEADARFVELRSLARFMLFELTDRLEDAPGTVAARARLAETASRYLDRLRAAPQAPVDLRLDAARGYRRLASLQGLSSTASLGRPDQAAGSLDHAQAMLAVLHAERPDDPDVLEELGRVALGRWSLSAGKRGTPFNDAATAWFARALAIEPGRPGALLGSIAARADRGYDLGEADQSKAALPVLRDALARLRTAAIPPALHRESLRLETRLLGRIGDALYYSDDMAGAVAPYREARALLLAELARRPSVMWEDQLAVASYALASTLADIGGHDREALTLLDEAVPRIRRVLTFGRDALAEKGLLELLGQRALVLGALGRRAEAAADSREGVALREARLATAPGNAVHQRDVGVALANHARVLAAAGARDEACAAARRGVALWDGMRRAGTLTDRDARIDVPRMAAAVASVCR